MYFLVDKMALDLLVEEKLIEELLILFDKMFKIRYIEDDLEYMEIVNIFILFLFCIRNWF